MKCRSKFLDNPTCQSPTACHAFGYCRERNFHFGMPSKEMIKEWQKEDEDKEAGK